MGATQLPKKIHSINSQKPKLKFENNSLE